MIGRLLTRGPPLVINKKFRKGVKLHTPSDNNNNKKIIILCKPELPHRSV